MSNELLSRMHQRHSGLFRDKFRADTTLAHVKRIVMRTLKSYRRQKKQTIEAKYLESVVGVETGLEGVMLSDFVRYTISVLQDKNALHLQPDGSYRIAIKKGKWY